MTNVDEGLVPETIKQQVSQVIALLLKKGIEYEEILAEQDHQQYEFLLPKSKYYRYYTHQLFQHGPTSRERQQVPQPAKREVIKVEGNIEMISVGAMCEIVKEEISQGKQAYQPFENQTYMQEITIDPHHLHLQLKVTSLIQKYGKLLSKKKDKEIKPENGKVEKNSSKMNELRKQMGGNNDGSLGVYGGKRYEGLGVRDQFANFRREKSQSYYQNVRQKAQNQ